VGNVEYSEITTGIRPGGIAVIRGMYQRQPHRTASDIPHCFAKNDGTLASTAASFLFDKKACFSARSPNGRGRNDDARVEAGAEDMQVLDDAFEITTDPGDSPPSRESWSGRG
jgi:transcriptional/translational regulatory protein YebC/TACO1